MTNKSIDLTGSMSIPQTNDEEKSIILVDWSAHLVGSDEPFQQTSTEHSVEVACPEAAHTALSGSGSRCSCSLRSAAVVILSGGSVRGEEEIKKKKTKNGTKRTRIEE